MPTFYPGQTAASYLAALNALANNGSMATTDTPQTFTALKTFSAGLTVSAGAFSAVNGTFSSTLEVIGDVTVGPAGIGAHSVSLTLQAGSNSGANDTYAVMDYSKGPTLFWEVGMDVNTQNNQYYFLSAQKSGGADRVMTLSKDGDLLVSGKAGINGQAAQGKYASGGLLTGVVAALIAIGVLSS